MSEIPPILFTFLRFAVVAAVLMPVLRLHPGHAHARGSLLERAELRTELRGIAARDERVVGRDHHQLSVPFATWLSVYARRGLIITLRERRIADTGI